MVVKGFVGPNDQNPESNLAGKYIRLEKGEVSSLFSFQVILGSVLLDYLLMNAYHYLEMLGSIFFSCQCILLFLSLALKALHDVLCPNLKHLMF